MAPRPLDRDGWGRLRARPALASALALAACMPGTTNGGDDGGIVVPEDACNSADDARSNIDCTFTARTVPADLCNASDPNFQNCEVGKLPPAGAPCGFISAQALKQPDRDWWLLAVPGPLAPPAILTVKGQYCVPSSPVTLAVNVLKPDGTTSLGRAVSNARGSAAEVVARIDATGDYFVIVEDDPGDNDPGTTDVDPRAPYKLAATTYPDPDTNEPNDDSGAPTYIAESPTNTWTQAGAIAITGDVDRFTFDVPARFARQILYLNLSAPGVTPASTLRLEYTITECPSPPATRACGTPGRVVAQDFAKTPFGTQTLVTARLVKPGRYQLVIDGYQAATDPSPPPGDPRLKYAIMMQLHQDLDTSEGPAGNDTAAQAPNVGIAAPGSHTLTGRISYVGDAEWYALDLPSGPGRRLKYRFAYTSATGRFTVPTLQVRELSVVVPSAIGCACCSAGNNTCADFCSRGQCLVSRRVEDPTVSGLSNFEGMLHVPASAAPTRWLVQFAYFGTAGVDDRAFKIDLNLMPQTAEEATAERDTTTTAIPLSIPGLDTAACVITSLGYGHGSPFPTQYRAPNGASLLPWGVADLDVRSDGDVIEVQIPTGLPAADYTWNVTWTVPALPGRPAGTRPYDLAFRFDFNDGSGSVTTRTMGYIGREQDPWCSGVGADAGSNCPRAALFTFNQSSGDFAVTPAACFCLRSAVVGAGRFFATVSADNRTAYDDPAASDSTARVCMTLSAYPPPSPPGPDGGSAYACPSPCGL